MDFNTVIGRNLLQEINSVAHEPFVIITMDDLWPIFAKNFDCEVETESSTDVEVIYNLANLI